MLLDSYSIMLCKRSQKNGTSILLRKKQHSLKKGKQAPIPNRVMNIAKPGHDSAQKPYQKIMHKKDKKKFVKKAKKGDCASTNHVGLACEKI